MRDDQKKDRIIRMVGDMIVEMPRLDRAGEEARRELDKLALRTYEETGDLGGWKLCEAETAFNEMAKEHLLKTEPDVDDGEDEA